MTTQLELLERDWIDANLPTVTEWIRNRMDPFTSDDIHTLCGDPPQPNWIGVMFAKLRNAGLIERIGWQESKRESANGRVVRLWQRRKAVDVVSER